jgi:hypothetical protein
MNRKSQGTKVETICIIEREIDEEMHELEILVVGRVFPGEAARLSGPPENCSPGESGYAEEIKATLKGEIFILSDEEMEKAILALVEKAEEEANEDYDGFDD